MIQAITTGISSKLKQEFGEAVTVYKESVEQGANKPCLFIFLIASSQKQVVGKRYFCKHSFRLDYIPSSEQKKNEEIAEVMDKLYQCLTYIDVEGEVLRGTSLRHETVEGTVQFFVNYDFYGIKQSETVDFMETVSVDNQLKG